MTISWIEDDAFSAFTRTRQTLDAASGTNEAATRLRAIDTILFDVLKWDKTRVEPEQYVRQQGYADYAFMSASDQIALILEAKKDGAVFTLPEASYPDRPVPFSLLSEKAKDAAAALRQAQAYANEHGARYTAISNGHQWLLTLTFVDHVPLIHRNVIVYESLDAIKERFRSFFQTFSPTAILTNQPYPLLASHRLGPPPAKLSARVAGYPKLADRNRLISPIRATLQKIWDDAHLLQDKEVFLERCYIRPANDDDALCAAAELLAKRKHNDDRLAEPVPADPKRLPFDRSAIGVEQPVVLLGRVGHGKSTFLDYLRHVTAKDILKNKYVQIDLDFLARPSHPSQVEDYLFSEIKGQLLGEYSIDVDSDAFARLCLRDEIRRFWDSPSGVYSASFEDEGQRQQAEVRFITEFMADRWKYFASVFAFIRSNDGKSVSIYFDNLDQRPDPIQEQAFLLASTCASQWAAMTFVCLRPSTLRISQSKGVLDTVAPRILVISPPKTQLVLRKRFQYARDYAAQDLPKSAYSDSEFIAGPPNQEAAGFFGMCDDSFHRDSSLSAQFEAVANGNVRETLKHTRAVLTSNHLDTQKIAESLRNSGRYLLAEHETLRALIYGAYSHYEPSESLFPNLFDLSQADGKEHFSRLLAIDYVQRQASDPSADRGFVSVDLIKDHLYGLGYTSAHVESVIEHLVERKCLEARDEISPRLFPTQLRATNLGRYLASRLVRTFVYLDAVVIDTPIMDTSVAPTLTDCEDIMGRLERARIFLRYLDREAEALSDSSARDLWGQISSNAANDIADVEQEAEASRTRAAQAASGSSWKKKKKKKRR